MQWKRGGGVSAALSLDAAESSLILDIAFPAAGGGMLTAVTAIRKTAPTHDSVPHALARAIVARHPFTKVVVVVDDDVDPASPEDVLWALVTQCNLDTDLVTANGLPAQPSDLSQTAEWLGVRGRWGGAEPGRRHRPVPAADAGRPQLRP